MSAFRERQSVTGRVANQAIALAGLFQSVSLVQQSAWEGRADPQPYAVCLGSLFKLNPGSYEEVYGGIEGVETGLRLLREQLAGQRGRSEPDQKTQRRRMELTRYAVTLLSLERKLSKRPEIVRGIQEGIQAAADQLAFFDLMHTNTVSRLAGLYQETLSRMGPRVIVNGEQSLLSNPEIASRIRALLLAGVRAGVLWRQAGGSRLRLLFGRRSILDAADKLLARQ